MEFHTEGAERVEFIVDNRVRKPELGNAVLQYAAYFMKRFENVHLEAPAGHLSGKGEAGRTASGNSYTDSV